MKRIITALLALPSLLGAQSIGPVLPMKHDPHPTESAITAEDLKTRLYIFADDSMMGRETGSRSRQIHGLHRT